MSDEELLVETRKVLYRLLTGPAFTLRELAFPLHVTLQLGPHATVQSFTHGVAGSTLDLRLRRDWLKTVHEPAISVVEGHLVLLATPAGVQHTPAGTESWCARILTVAGQRVKGPLEITQYLVRYADLARMADDPFVAYGRCLDAWRRAFEGEEVLE